MTQVHPSSESGMVFRPDADQFGHVADVEIVGHIIDSLILPKVLDEILAAGGRFEIEEVRVGGRRTDPSYARQIVTLTCPHIGNTGVTPEDLESDSVHAAGLVIRDLPRLHSSWRASHSLAEFLIEGETVAIAGIDTRKLTRILRERGAQGGCIATADKADADVALRAARAFPGLKGMDLAKVVSVRKPYQWNEGSIGREPSRVGGR